MRAFLETYGIAIFTLVIIGIMVLMASGVGATIEDLVEKEIKQFAQVGKTEMDNAMTKKEDGNNGSGEEGGTGGSEEVTFTSEQLNLETNSWADVQAVLRAGKAEEAGWAVGDTKKVMISGTEYTATLIGFDCDGSNTATFMILDGLSEKRSVNSDFTNVGGWEASEIRSYLNNDIYNSITDLNGNNLKNQIKTVTKKSNNTGTTQTTDTQDKLFLLSAKELNISAQINTGFIYEYFKENKLNPSSNAWLRDADLDSNDCFSGCMNTNGIIVNFATIKYLICPAFVIG